ncbi:MAG: hypothetical protein NT018_00350 [Armatimonadetes bacterium]|nr:hypothetical protein [Armatimonadota bacterium]
MRQERSTISHQAKCNKVGTKGREAEQDGWFSFEMKVLPDQPMQMVCKYWGFDYWRECSVKVDGKEIAKQSLARKKPDEWLIETYPIPEELTKGKDKITVRYESTGWSIVGGLYGCRIVKP